MSDGEGTDCGLVATLEEIATSPAAGQDVVALAGELLAEDARFNQWVLGRKSRSTAVEQWSLAALARSQAERCAAAWHQCRGCDERTAPAAYRNLTDVLSTVRSELEEIRTSGVVTYRDPEMPAEIADW